MKIHQVVETFENLHEIDPRKGPVLRKERVLKEGSTTAIDDPTHGHFEIGPDGSFDVPDELGVFLCRTPDWFEGPNPFASSLGHVGEDRTNPVRKAKAKA